jgi:hypothetical protein
MVSAAAGHATVTTLIRQYLNRDIRAACLALLERNVLRHL